MVPEADAAMDGNLPLGAAAVGPLRGRRQPAGPLAACQQINAQGISVRLDHLGENVSSLAEAGRFQR